MTAQARVKVGREFLLRRSGERKRDGAREGVTAP